MAKKPEPTAAAVTKEAVVEKPTTAVAVVAPTGPTELALPADDMAMLAADAGRGAEAVTQDDKMIPFVRIIQSLSPQRARNKPEFIPGAEEGDILNTMTQSLAKSADGIFFVPVAYQRNFTEWWPRDSKQGKGLVKNWGPDASALNGTTPNDRKQSMTKNGTVITPSGDFFGFVLKVRWVEGEDGVLSPQFNGMYDPVVISMTGAQMRKSRTWVTRLTTERIPVNGQMIQPPLFFRAWHLTTVPESNDDGAWFGWKIDPHEVIFSLPRGRELYLEARSFSESVAAGEVKAAPPVDEAAGSEDGAAIEGEVAGDAIPY